MTEVEKIEVDKGYFNEVLKIVANEVKSFDDMKRCYWDDINSIIGSYEDFARDTYWLLLKMKEGNK